MRKKAFTLTELLVVVVIIGVLSAVVLPKFTKILDTRKATEAESVMAAVRNEQEARCTLDKDYTGVASKLASLPKSSKHFTYSLDAKGITATGPKYTLKIPSYTDGRICCDDTCEGCAKKCNDLNRNYPKCSELVYEEATCSVPSDEKPVDGCDLTDWVEECSAKYGDEYEGTIEHTVTASCEYADTENCTKKESPIKSCDESKKPGPETRDCHVEGDEEGENCGEQTRSAFCSADTDYEWIYRDEDWGECSAVEGKCSPGSDGCAPGAIRQTSCACGVAGQEICNAAGTDWEPYENGTCELTEEEKATCSCQEKPEDETKPCDKGFDGNISTIYECKDGAWVPKEENECENNKRWVAFTKSYMCTADCRPNADCTVMPIDSWWADLSGYEGTSCDKLGATMESAQCGPLRDGAPASGGIDHSGGGKYGARYMMWPRKEVSVLMCLAAEDASSVSGKVQELGRDNCPLGCEIVVLQRDVLYETGTPYHCTMDTSHPQCDTPGNPCISLIKLLNFNPKLMPVDTCQGSLKNCYEFEVRVTAAGEEGYGSAGHCVTRVVCDGKVLGDTGPMDCEEDKE